MASVPDNPVAPRSADSGFGRFLALILSDRERFFAEVAEGEGLPAKLVHALFTLLVLCALYGAAAGAYAGPAQALSAAIKLPLLFLGTLAICFPGFFVIQVLVGSRLRLPQVLALVLGAHGLAPFLHNGSAASVLDVLANVAHRSAGTGGVDKLAETRDRERLARFVESIDARTEPFPIPGAAATALALGENPALASAGRLELALAGANPAGAVARLRFVLPGRGRVSLELFDVQGRRLATLADGVAEAGAHEVRWNGVLESGARARAGVYLARLRSDYGARVLRIVRE